MYGKHACIAAISNENRVIHEVLLTKSFAQNNEELLDSVLHNSRFRDRKFRLVLEQEILKFVGENAVHQGICLRVEPLRERSWDEMLSNHNCSVAILDHVTDPQNLGAVVRSAAAFMVDHIILCNNNSVRENAVVAKAAAGALEKVSLNYVSNIVSTIDRLKSYGFWVVGLDGHAKELLSSKHFGKRTCMIFGSEGCGMRRLTKENCDFIAKIPMCADSESINISNAAAITFYENYKFVMAN
jgi:23S rRNA (guanosine2251-2'-O)-methyltransferase